VELDEGDQEELELEEAVGVGLIEKEEDELEVPDAPSRSLGPSAATVPL
jgi:hypothetical protein